MTLRYLIAVDPGVSGAYATFADGQLEKVVRLPVNKYPAVKSSTGKVVTKAKSVFQVHDFIDQMRALMLANRGASFTAVMEQVGTNAMGDAGMISIAKLVAIAHAMEGVLLALGWDLVWVPPTTWKRHHGLLKQDKDASRAKAKAMFPWLKLETKASADLAEAALIGAYGVHRYGE